MNEIFISYAQNFEDVMLWRALKHVEQGFYIDVGAWSPDVDSVTRAFYDRGWRGINIEPHPKYHRLLQETRLGDVNLNIALADGAGQMYLHIVEDTGLSTLNKDIAARHEAEGYPVRVEQSTVLTLDNVWDAHVVDRTVHFMNIDVEGSEGMVLRGNDWTRHRPWILVIEAMSPNSQKPTHEEWEPLLLEHDYQFAYADGLNRFFVASERSEQIPAFQFPPNFFDQFKRASQSRAEAFALSQEKVLKAAVEKVDALRSSVRLAEARLATNREQLRRLQHEIEAHAEKLAEARKEAKDNREALARAKEDIRSLNQELSGARDGARTLGEELAAAKVDALTNRGRAEQLQHQVLSMHFSKSWRLTAPLRKIAEVSATARDSVTGILSGALGGFIRALNPRGQLARVANSILRNMRLRRLMAGLLVHRPRARASLHSLVLRIASYKPDAQNVVSSPQNLVALAQLSESAQVIYIDLLRRYELRDPSNAADRREP